MTGRTRSWSRERWRRKRVRALLIAVAVLVFALPLAWTFVASFGIHPDTSSWPPRWSKPYLDGYRDVGIAEKDFGAELLTSAATSSVATILSVLVGFLASFSLARSRLRGKGRLAQGFLVLASLPVMAYIIPLNGTITALSLHDTFAGISLAQAAIFSPFAVYVLFGYLRQVPLELEQAARLEGASALRTLLGVTLPVAGPGIAAAAIIVFVLNWNSFLAPMVLTTNHVRTIPLAMSDFFIVDRELEWPTAAAALVVSVLPLIAFVAVAHRALERFFLQPTSEAG